MQVETNYSIAMLELSQQRAQAMQKEQEALLLQSAANVQPVKSRIERDSTIQLSTPANSETKVVAFHQFFKTMTHLSRCSDDQAEQAVEIHLA